MTGISPFHQQVYAIARAIPPGSTRTYGEVAQQIGSKGLAFFRRLGLPILASVTGLGDKPHVKDLLGTDIPLTDVWSLKLGGRYGLLKEGTRQAVEIPTPIQPQVAWVLERDRFAKRELVAAFPAEDGVKIDRLLGELGRMALIEPA